MKILILGAGISGLSLAWFLQKKLGDQASIAIIEKEEEVGGWISTSKTGGFLFEKGPSSFRWKGAGEATLALVHELGLTDQLIVPQGKKRFLWKEGALQQLPSSLSSSLFSPLMRGAGKAFLRQLCFPPKVEENDLSIEKYAISRFGEDLARTMIEPMVLGIYGGDSRQLSMQSCFPKLCELEQQHGTLLKGFLFCKKEKKPQDIPEAPFYSFLEGMGTLPKALASKISAEIYLKRSVERLTVSENKVRAHFKEGVLEADYLFSTLPARALAPLVSCLDPAFESLLQKIPSASIDLVQFGFQKQLLKHAGFGYLIPSSEKEKLLGAIFGSAIFPQQKYYSEETRLSFLLGGARHADLFTESCENSIEIALRCLKEHLDISCFPDQILHHRLTHAIPQYLVGHAGLVKMIEERSHALSSKIILLGNSFYGVSVNDCIARAKKIAEEFN